MKNFSSVKDAAKKREKQATKWGKKSFQIMYLKTLPSLNLPTNI